LKVGIAQVCSGSDADANLAMVSDFVAKANAAHCDLICFPENVFYRGPKKTLNPEVIFSIGSSELVGDSTFSKKVAELIHSSKAAISFGSVLQKSSDVARPYNSHLFIDRAKKVTAYQKIHLFCFSGTAANYDESLTMSFGERPQTVEFENFTIGLSICYDLRFPELFRDLAINGAADVLLVPAAFTLETGRAHWHTLLRARAIENLSYVIAAGQWGEHTNDEGKRLACYGHSLAYTPWGDLLGEAAETGDDLVIVNLERAEIEKRRKQLPIFESASRSPFWKK
jgi:predicted amidohydrolase